jgi:hypothetical protein
MAYPPGYYEYWLYGLAIRLCGPFGRPVPPTTAQLFQERRAEIRRMNSRAPRLNSEWGGHGEGLYNWKSGLVDA